MTFTDFPCKTSHRAVETDDVLNIKRLIKNKINLDSNYDLKYLLYCAISNNHKICSITIELRS